ncbi:HU family DNA-binding protein [Candidatus Phytoplasma rubi]|uniref:HU family DNA-binding protein n=1 Tax=Candidatus Phytoplasma rubi TaxID=399025 RepID=UPI0022860C3F|nr:HU family DNA-binding protein [Candidatus Phytoplasma rubi]
MTKTEEFYNSFEECSNRKRIKSNEEVVLSPQIGKFKLKTRKAYIGRNPKTRKKLKIPAKTVITFKLSQTIKDQAKTLILK